MSDRPSLDADYTAARLALDAARAAVDDALLRRDLARLGVQEAAAALVALGLVGRCNHCNRPCERYMCAGCREEAVARRRGSAPKPPPSAPRVRARRERAGGGPVHVWALAGGGEELERVDPRCPVLTTPGGHRVEVGRAYRGRVYQGVRGAGREREKGKAA